MSISGADQSEELHKFAASPNSASGDCNSRLGLENVNVTYDTGTSSVKALEGMTLRVAASDFVALVGPSGCGKSTALKVLAGIVRPTAGKFYVFNCGGISEHVRIGMAFQNPTLLPWLSIIDNVMLPLKIVPPFRQVYRKKRKSEFRERAEMLLKRVGLAGFSDKRPWELSGGMLQRASLCRALIHEPQLLLLDEPFGALDQFTREELWSILQELWLSLRPTVLLVTHDLREASFLANRIYVLSARPGRVVAETIANGPRPRTLTMTYEPAFVALIQRLHKQITAERTNTLI
jgi:NitT/TauT family transport system ATP-binding protein